MLNNGRNEAVSVLDFLLQTFSNSIYLEQDVQIRINYLLLKSSRGSISFSTSIALPQPPEECHTVSAFPQTHGKLDISPGKAAQHKRQKKTKSDVYSNTSSLWSINALDIAILFL